MNIERKSYVSIVHCIFKELEGIILLYISELVIRGSHFLQNKNTFQISDSGLESLLHISHSKFERNEPKNIELNSGLMTLV